jgi:hypothetical protein
MKNTYTNTIYDNIEFALSLHGKDMILSTLGIVNNKTHIDQYTNEYYINDLNFRDSRNWQPGEPSDIVALGCSQTFGVSVPQEYTWPSIIENKTGKTVANLGICGASAEKMLDSFLYYLDNIGIPKYVFACFPDHLRYSHVVEGSFYKIDSKVDKTPRSKKVVSNLRTSDHITGEVHIKDKVIKLPTDPRYLIPTQEAISQYISSIYTIEKVCKLLGIKFYWGTWKDESQIIFTKNLFLKNNFCLDSEKHLEEINSNHQKDCKSYHLLEKIELDKYKDTMWDRGYDNIHLGIHWQFHTAESFIKKIGDTK